ncbi:MAG TPA: vanadium-dependent haloperoxidase [Thermoanaerobaculia bacterium]|nr:vanadium-dependent haloperoxidase [Thermoanaerobaculia bacterium]
MHAKKEEIRPLEPREAEGSPALSRRKFLGGMAATVAAGTVGLEALATAAPEAAAAPAPRAPQGGSAKARARRERAFQIRYEAALEHLNKPYQEHRSNGDEDRYPSRIGNYSKGLPHNAFGEVDETAYESFLAATRSGTWDDFLNVQTSGGRKLTSPQAGLAFDLQGVDAHDLAVRPAPALRSAEAAGEAVELYWMALLRDVNFLDYGSSALAEEAVADLNRLRVFKGAREGGQVTAQSLFRDPLPGTLNGPYISQFMWKPTPYGAEYVERRMLTYFPGSDHLTSYDDWLESQNGFGSFFVFHDPERRYIRNGRDLSEWVHNDVLFQAYFNACLILSTPLDPFSPPTGGGIGAPFNPGYPYRGIPNQTGFATFGEPWEKTILCEVATRALKATWFQKWFVHRRLRPEAYAGRVHNQIEHDRYPGVLHRDVLNSKAVEKVHSKNGTYLMPMAFPEGSPTHPSYTAGHATVAGACVTVLKALFDENYIIPTPVMPTPDGLALQPYQGPPLTVGGELNKLASNIATGRNIAGVHWRSDANESMKLGEAIAISILKDQRTCYNERFNGLTFTKFDGTKVTI